MCSPFLYRRTKYREKIKTYIWHIQAEPVPEGPPARGHDCLATTPPLLWVTGHDGNDKAGGQKCLRYLSSRNFENTKFLQNMLFVKEPS